MFRLILVSLLSSFISTQVEAKTIRYEFDVLRSSIGYNWLFKVLPDSDGSVSGPEYAGFTAKYHPLGAALGKTGPVVLEAAVNYSSHYPNGRLSCVSGFLCAVTAFSYSLEVNFPYLSSSVLSGFSAWPGGYEWSLHIDPSGQGALSFFDDGGIYGCGNWNGSTYCWGAALASFTLSNLTITEIAPVPLPATAWLLGLGILAVSLKTRRHARAA